MSSKAQRRKHRQRQKQAMAGVVATHNAPHVPNPQGITRAAERPTDERKARGAWAVPQGALKAQQPFVSLTSDEIGNLYHRGKITNAQEQAARSFQQTRATYRAEIGLNNPKSCLDASIPGFDDGDGDPAAIEAYRNIEAKLSLPERRELIWVCDGDGLCRSLELLASALDVVAGAKRGRYVNLS